jgi:hypothetical protein
MLSQIQTYNTLIQCLTRDYQTDLSIAPIAVIEINKLGPFETGEFEVCDVIKMLGDLYSQGEIDRELRVSEVLYNGSETYEFLFKVKSDIQPDLFP